MPKRGLRQPWRVTYQWANGVKGSKSFHSADDANLFRAQLQRSSSANGQDITITVEDRGAR